MFLYDLFTHKEIDTYGHIYYLFVKSIQKRNARLFLLFPSLIMSLKVRAKVKIPSGLLVMQREDPISFKPSSEAKLTSSDQASVFLKFREMMLQKKEETLIRKLSISLESRRILHDLLLKHKQEHLIAMIIYLEELKSCI